MSIENILNVLIKKRAIVLGVLAVILAGSFFAGYTYQKNVDRKNEASVIFDDTWQKIYAILNDIQSQPDQIYTANSPSLPQARSLYLESLSDLELLIYEYSDTIAGARSALLVQTVLSLSNLNSILPDQTILLTLAAGIEDVQQKHPEFWGAVIAMNNGIIAEQQFDFAKALNMYKEALNLDKKKYLHDYIIIAIARNNEVLGNVDEAINYYQQIEDDYPDSVWLPFAIGKKYILSAVTTQ